MLVRDNSFEFDLVIMRSGLGHITCDNSTTFRIAAVLGERTFFSGSIVRLIGDFRLVSSTSEIRRCDETRRPGRNEANALNSVVTRRSFRAFCSFCGIFGSVFVGLVVGSSGIWA